MSARKLEAYEFEHTPESNQTPLYQDYTPEAPVGPNLKEILFFEKKLVFLPAQNEDKRHFWRLSFYLFKNILSHHLIFQPRTGFRTK